MNENDQKFALASFELESANTAVKAAKAAAEVARNNVNRLVLTFPTDANRLGVSKIAKRTRKAPAAAPMETPKPGPAASRKP